MLRFLLVTVFILSSTALSFAATVKKPADGLYREYYVTGVVQREENYKNYVLDGPAKTFFEDGGLASAATYVDGKRQGPGKTFIRMEKQKPMLISLTMRSMVHLSIIMTAVNWIANLCLKLAIWKAHLKSIIKAVSSKNR